MKKRKRKHKRGADVVPARSDRVERLTPLDAQFYASEEPSVPSRSVAGDGVLRVTTSSLHLPDELVTESDAGGEKAANRVLLVIVAIALTFIAFIAWLIARSPA